MADELTKIAEDSARGSFFLISGNALSTIIMSISAIVIGRFLGSGLYGQYTLALVVPQILYLFTDMGITSGISKYSADLNLKGEHSRLTGIIKYAMLLKAGAGFILFSVNYFLADLFASLLQRPELAFYIRIVAFSILFQVIFSTASSAFVGLDKSEFHAIALNIQAVAKTVIQIALVVVGFSVAGALVGHVASYVVASAASVLMLSLLLRRKRKADSHFSISVSRDIKRLINYGTPLYLSVLVSGLIPLFQSVMLATFTTDADVGNYRAAINFASLLGIFSIPITTALLPAFSKFDSSAGEKIRTFFKLANKYTCMLVVPVAMLLILYSNQVVSIVYGSTYETAGVFLSFYLFLYFLVGIGYLTLASFFNGLGETRMSLWMSLITFSVLAILSPLMTQSYGVSGMIVAFLVASLIGQSYGSFMARRRFHIEFDTSSLMKIYMTSAISILPSFFLLNYVPLHEVASLAMGAFLFLSMYATLTPLDKVLTVSEIRMLTEIVGKIKLLAPFARPVLKYEQKLAYLRKQVSLRVATTHHNRDN